MRVLIVEDEPYMAESIGDGLRLAAIAAEFASGPALAHPTKICRRERTLFSARLMGFFRAVTTSGTGEPASVRNSARAMFNSRFASVRTRSTYWVLWLKRPWGLMQYVDVPSVSAASSTVKMSRPPDRSPLPQRW